MIFLKQKSRILFDFGGDTKSSPGRFVFAKSEIGSVKVYRQYHLARWQVMLPANAALFKEKPLEAGLPKIELKYIGKYDDGASAGEIT